MTPQQNSNNLRRQPQPHHPPDAGGVSGRNVAAAQDPSGFKPTKSEPMIWGFQARISIYVEGERDSALAIAATQAAARVFKDAGRIVQFGGATVLPVHDEPMGR